MNSSPIAVACVFVTVLVVWLILCAFIIPRAEDKRAAFKDLAFALFIWNGCGVIGVVVGELIIFALEHGKSL